MVRPHARGKFLFTGDRKFYIRGVTYGTFGPNGVGIPFPGEEVIERDMATMSANGINAIRVYSVPPRWLLDLAEGYGIYVMVGLPWEQHIAFLDDRERGKDIEAHIRAGVRACSGHRAVLCYAVGNEIPAPIVRWYGHRRVEAFLKRLYQAAKEEDPEGLVTYVNYPSTEYLPLSFTDFVCFNVYIENQERLDAYLSRLQNLAGDRPLVMAEVGLDSRRHGEEAQANTLAWQLRTVYSAGAAGAFVFSWTDEWHRGGHAIEDWDFGLTDRKRQPKAALAAVRSAFADAPFRPDTTWPRISVAVCSHNGAHTLHDCFTSLRALKYPNFEVIVVDDGSMDGTADIAREYGFSVISTDNRGLGSARNTAMEAATGAIVAYTDDDAYPDPDWLNYLAHTFMTTEFAAVGGPNLPPPGDGCIADCVANAPGGPVHVLLNDEEAEHIPGCNMAFRTECLQEIGGFDPQFRAAGDDVDVCWRLQERGWKIGFSPAAIVWHHRRNSIRAYWRQQVGYGKAEALLERKWPEKYDELGHARWSGRIYGSGLRWSPFWRRERIYHGIWGTAPFQSIHHPGPSLLASLPLMPEWCLALLVLGGLTILGILWPPLLLAAVPFVLGLGLTLVQPVLSATHAEFQCPPRSRLALAGLRGLTALMHLLQPHARLYGRVRYGLVPWRAVDPRPMGWPLPFRAVLWSEQRRDAAEWLGALVRALLADGVRALPGGDYDRWDLEVRTGPLGAARVHMAIEEHGAGRQLVRLRAWPRSSASVIVVAALALALSVGAGQAQAWLPCAVLAAFAGLVALGAVHDSGAAVAAVERSVRHLRSDADADRPGAGLPLAASRAVAESTPGSGWRLPHDAAIQCVFSPAKAES